jgi:hypothetical protein
MWARATGAEHMALEADERSRGGVDCWGGGG